MKKDIYRLKINEKFAGITPTLKRCEREILEQDIIKNGCLTPILVWNGMIVDGLQRYNICRNHKIPFTYEEMDFGSEGEAIVWIIRNQMGRRNLSSFQRCEMVLRFEPELKADAEKRSREAISYYRSTGKRRPGSMDTRDILANMAGVAHSTFRQAKAICLSGDEVTKDRLRNGEISINYAYNTIYGHTTHADIETESGRNSVDLSEIGDAVSSLREKVASGDASQKMMLEELDHIYSLIAGGSDDD